MAGKRRILVLEDETLVAMALEQMLADDGYDCVGPFAEAAPALEAARRHPMDAAILDIVLAGASDYSVAEVLSIRMIPFGFVSAIPQDKLERRWQKRPYVGKPFLADDIRQLLHTLAPIRQ